MAQSDMVISDQVGASFLPDINSVLAALATNSSGATEPETAYAFQVWADTTADRLKIRNAANDGWVSVLVLSTGAPVSGADAPVNTNITAMSALASVPNGTVANLPSVTGAAKNLKASASGSSANIAVSADELVLGDASNRYVVGRALSITVAGTSVGANGLDAGALATSTWYSLWVIWNGTTFAGLLSLSATTPTLPSGYTHKARVGWIRTDGTANKYPLGYMQRGRSVTYLIGSGNVATPPQMASGSAGTYSNSTFTGVAVAWANFAPPTATKLNVGMSANTTGILIGVASNANRSGYATVNPPEIGFNSSAWPLITFGELLLESSNIYWACSSSTGYLLAGGWEDDL